MKHLLSIALALCWAAQALAQLSTTNVTASATNAAPAKLLSIGASGQVLQTPWSAVSNAATTVASALVAAASNSLYAAISTGSTGSLGYTFDWWALSQFTTNALIGGIDFLGVTFVSASDTVVFSNDMETEGNVIIGGNLASFGTSNNIGGLIVTNGGAYAPSFNSPTGSLSSGSIGTLTILNKWNAGLGTNVMATNLVGSAIVSWEGPTNSIALGCGYTPSYFYTLTNNASVTNLTGLISAGEWTASLLLTNGTSSNVTFSVSSSAIRILGGMTNTVITVPAGLTCDVAFGSQTNGINISRVVAIVSNN